MTHQDFVVRIDQVGQGYLSRVLSPPARGGAEPFVSPIDPAEVGAIRTSLDTTIRNLSQTASAGTARSPELTRDLGAELYAALFKGQVKALFDESWGKARNAQQGLRIKLQFDLHLSDSAWLAELPWELLHAPDRATFFGLNPETPVVRDLEGQAPDLDPFSPPLQVLAVSANPLGTTELDLEAEWREIERAAGESKMRVTLLPKATLGAMVERLQTERFHVLHFMGHGSWEPTLRQGVLLFESADGRPEAVSGKALANNIQGHRSLRLAVLNACRSGEPGTATKDPFAGVATTLVQAGLPAAVAMRTSISDSGAIAFSKSLYRALAQGLPVDVAVTYGRRAMAPDSTASLEWSIPMLFLREGDTRWFAVDPEPRTVDATVPAEPTRGIQADTYFEKVEAQEFNVARTIKNYRK